LTFKQRPNTQEYDFSVNSLKNKEPFQVFKKEDNNKYSIRISTLNKINSFDKNSSSKESSSREIYYSKIRALSKGSQKKETKSNNSKKEESIFNSEFSDKITTDFCIKSELIGIPVHAKKSININYVT
jgi:hypothetical protein